MKKNSTTFSYKCCRIFTVLFAALFILPFSLSAQTPSWLFEGGAGSANAENGKAVCVDAAGNVYVTGSFANTVDFDFGAGVANLVSNGSNDIFIASYTSAGVYRWAVRAGGVAADNAGITSGICTDGVSVYATGNYSGAATLFGATSLTPAGGAGTDGFVAKLNAATGAWTWAISLGGTGNTDYVAAICLDVSGNPYILGQFNNTLTTGSCNITSGGGSELYVMKLVPGTGACTWATAGGSTLNDVVGGGGICYDPITAQVVVASNFNGGTATYGGFTLPNSGANDMCVLELNSISGAFTQAVGAGTINSDDAIACAYDPSTGNVYVTGAFNGASMTLPGGITLTNAGLNDSWVGCYSEASNIFTWAKAGGGTANDRANGICVDGAGTVLVAGSYISNPATFGAQSLTNTNSGGFDDVFVVGYSAVTGTEIWATKNTNSGVQPSANNAKGIALQPSTANFWIGGQYAQGCTFGALGPLNSAGFNDFYIAKFLCPPPLTATQSQVNLTCNGVCNGSATVVASGGLTPYTYSWSPSGGSGATASNLCATNYTCTITDANSTSITKTFSITQPSAITSSVVSQTNISCNGGSNGAATITASGGTGVLTYNWTPGNPTGDGTVSVTGLTVGTWTCTITDANGCTHTQTVNITQPAALVVTPLSQTNISCNGGSNGAASVTVSGGTTAYSYNWTPGNPTGDGTASVTGLTVGTWTCTVTDANNCVSTATFNITQPSAITSSVVSQTNISCNGGSNGAATITASGGTGVLTYNWTPGNPTGDGTVSVTGLTVGTWTCTITDANGCTHTQTVNITQPAALVVTPVSQTNIACNGGSNGAASVTVTGGTTAYSYNWTPGNPTGDGTASVTGLTVGTWTCTVTDANLCTSTATFNITQPSALVVTPVSQTNISCNGGSNGAASVTVSGGTTAYSYNWTPGNPTGDGTASVTGLTAGTWTCTVTDANSCVTTQTFNITQPSAIVVTPASQTNISCNGGSNGAASVSASGGTGVLTYNWTPGNPTGDGTNSVTGLTSGTWTCTVTDANACTNTATFNITQPSALVVTPVSQTNIACNGGSNGAASVTVSGGTTAYSYNWTPGNPTGDGTASVTGLTVGTWTCTVTDANSCTSTATFNITQPSAITSSVVSQTNISCNGGSNGAATITASGGTGVLTYNWTPGNPTGDGTVSVTGLTALTWTCTITDANGCTHVQTVNITQPTALVASALSQTNIACNGGSNGAASVSVSGGTTAYSYNWTPGNPTGDGTASVTGLTAGTWTCTVTDANGCTTTQTFNITQPLALVASALSQTNISCNGGSNGAASVTVSGGTTAYSYNWTPGNPTGDGTASVTGLTAGTWTCTVTDANSCTTTQTFNITQPAALVASAASQTNISCNGGSNGAASVTVSGGTTAYSYNWTPGNPTGDGTASVTGLTVGTWTCTVTDANSCTTTQTFNITQPSAITASISSTPSSCSSNTGTATVSGVSGGTGPYTYSWAPPGATSASISGLAPFTYTCTITDANGCSITMTVTVTGPPSPTLTASSQTNISCNGGSNGAASVNAATGGVGPYTYNWTPGNPIGDGTVSVTGLTAGTWTCTVTDANGCTATQTFNITQPSALVASAVSQTNISCNGGSNGAASVTVSGGTTAYSYNWTPGNPTGDGTASVTGLTAGTWTCTVTDANSCTTTQTFNITQPSALSASTMQTNVSCNGGNNGDAMVMVSGGTAAYTYTWAPSGGNAASASSLMAGTYTCTITDANGCILTQTFNITEPSALTASNMQTNVSCNGGNNGDAMVMVSGGTGAYTYTWTPSGGNASSASGLTAGSYTCTITDANSCILTQTFNITEPSALSASTMQTNVSCNGGNNGDAMVMVSGGTGAYTYAWTPSGGNAASASSLTAGTYTCTITDANSCTLTQTFNITEPNALTASTTQTNISCNGGNNGDATVMVSGGTGAYTYAWTPSGGNASTASGLTFGTYTCTITDANGCILTQTLNITEPTSLAITPSQTDVSCNGGSNGVATVAVTGGTAAYTYAWAPSGGNAATASSLIAGTYTCTVTDANGCTLTQTFAITEPTVLSSSFTQVNVSCFGGMNGSIDLSETGGTSPYNFDWNSGAFATEDISSLTAGSYAYVITDANGCLSNGTVIITEPTALVAVVSSTTNPSVCGASDGGIDITVSGGTTAYTFLWSNATTNEDLSNATAGNYNCTITDANGCTTSINGALNDPNAPTVSVLFDTTLCSTGGVYTLTEGTPVGGTWSGTAVTGNTFDPAAAGVGSYILSYTYTDINGCTGSASDTMLVDACLGITEQSPFSVQLYPNPFSDFTTIHITGISETKGEVIIYNAPGQIVKKVPVQKNETIIDKSGMASGLYFYEVIINGSSINKGKLIVE